nr:MAG TPA: hypothetical protein [Caudoviricetes sp.]
MQRVYIRRNGKEILLTEQEMWQERRISHEN